MPTEFDEAAKRAALLEPFPAGDVEWRLQQSGIKNDKIWAMAVPYITNRAIMHRLDDVFGIFGWKNEFIRGPEGGVMCGISVLVDDEWVTKYDGAENTQIEAVKGGISDAMKRAAVQWGIGRYLYTLDHAFVQTTGADDRDAPNRGEAKGAGGQKVPFRWYDPKLPAHALPKPTRNGLEELPKTQEKPKTAENGPKSPQDAPAPKEDQAAVDEAKRLAGKLQENGKGGKLPAGGEPASQAALTAFLRAVTAAAAERKEAGVGAIVTELIASIARRCEWKPGTWKLRDFRDVTSLGEDRLRGLTEAIECNPLKFELEFTG